MAKKNRKIASRGYRAFRVCNVIIMILLMVVILVPILSVVVNSFVSAAEIARRGVFILWPEEIDIGSYQYLWECRGNILRAYGNTLFRTVVGTALSLIVTAMMAYSLSKKYLKGRVVINGMVFFTMLFGGGLIPTYMVVKMFGLIDSLWSMVIPGMVSAWNMFIMRNFFYSIPESLEEAALIDGASKWQQTVYITLPLLRPIISIMFIMAVGNIFRSDFGLFYQATRNSGSLVTVTQTIDVYIYKALLENPNINLSSAASLLQSVFGCITIVVANKVVKKIDPNAGLF